MLRALTNKELDYIRKEAQSHSGLSSNNKLMDSFIKVLQICDIEEDLISYLIDEVINNYMIILHDRRRKIY